MKNPFFLVLFALITLAACKSDDEIKKETKEAEEKAKKENVVDKIENEPGFQDIEVLFDDEKFSSADEMNLLKEIKICSDDPAMTENSDIVPCLPDNFKLMKLQEDLSLKNGFILIIKAETGGFPLRRVLIFQRERGELVKTNGFVGNIIGRIASKSGYDNLLIRFRDKDEAGFPMFYNCLFVWKDGKYEYKQVEVIEGPNWGGSVKDEFKEATSKDIYESIMNNKMLF